MITQAYNDFGAGDFRPDFKYVLHGDIKNVTGFFFISSSSSDKKIHLTQKKIILYWH